MSPELQGEFTNKQIAAGVKGNVAMAISWFQRTNAAGEAGGDLGFSLSVECKRKTDVGVK